MPKILDAIEDDSIEIEGTSQDEALQRACEALNTKLENLGFKVLEEGKKSGGGFMGMMRGGGKKIRIRAWRKDLRGQESLSPEGKLAKEALTMMIRHICEEYRIEAMEQEQTITLLVETDEGGLVIGRNGNTLDALQYLVRRVVGRKFPESEKQIIVNTEGYRERKQDHLVAMARRLAKKVRTSQQKEILEPMNAFERRLVHMALQEESGVVTESQGEGMDRCIVIYPEKGSSRGKNESQSAPTDPENALD